TFFSKVDLSIFENPFEIEKILNYVNDLSKGDQAAKAAIDIALHDLVAKIRGVPVYELLGLSRISKPTCMTIGIDTPEKMADKATEYKEFKYLKIKLGTKQDEDIITAIRRVTDQPFFIDANQGWKHKEKALDFIYWLNEQNTVFVEQPMNKENIKGNAWL